MNDVEIYELICRRLNDITVAKESPHINIGRETVILDGSMPIDSLDLAAIVVELENVTGHDPFRDGFVNFRTVGQLASLYSGAK